MKMQTALAAALLATTLGSPASLSWAQESADDALQAQTQEQATAEAAAELGATSDQLDAENFGPGIARGPVRLPHGPVGPRPGFPGGFHPPVGPRPVPYHPVPVYPRPWPRPVPVYHGGYYPWRHWVPPVVIHRPYPFIWNTLRTVTCTAQNSYGYQFPVTETGYFGYGYQSRIQQIEDAAVDRCYAETGGDQSCYLVGCTPGY